MRRTVVNPAATAWGGAAAGEAASVMPVSREGSKPPKLRSMPPRSPSSFISGVAAPRSSAVVAAVAAEAAEATEAIEAIEAVVREVSAACRAAAFSRRFVSAASARISSRLSACERRVRIKRGTSGESERWDGFENGHSTAEIPREREGR